MFVLFANQFDNRLFRCHKLTLSNYCNFIREFVEEKGVILCDLYNDIEYNENLFPDGLHPNNAGHRLIARDLMNYIK